ncbi:Putative f-box domain containing protein [Fusarium acuminatum]|uniref:F-box domain containing protein n=1 Tax=Fusarium acuminatum TaxID=5515 RepID=A0ABZ2X5S4_9HYPO
MASLSSSLQWYSNLTSVKQLAYSTIKITNGADIERLYPLLLSYANNSTRANSLREVIVDTYSWPSHYSIFYDTDDPVLLPQESGKGLDAKRANRGHVDHDAHSFLERHVTSLGLEDHLTGLIVEALAWKKQHWLGHVPDDTRDFDNRETAFAAAALVVLFSLCENLSVLRIDSFPAVTKEYLLRNNYGQINRPALRRLETVEFFKEEPLDSRLYETVDFLEYFRLFGRLPTMSILIMEGVFDHEVVDLVFPGTTNIRRIQLSHIEISGWTLSMIIRAPKVLEELRISTGGLWALDPGMFDMPCKTIGKSLLQHRSTLRILDLDVSFGHGEDRSREELLDQFLAQSEEVYLNLDKESSDIPFWLDDIPDDRPYGSTIGSLHDFNAMTHLSIGISALLGPPYEIKEPPFRLVDALPPNLEYLCLYGYVEGEIGKLDSHVEEFMQHKESRFPQLVEVQGVDKTILGIANFYAGYDRLDEEDLWKWPEKEWKCIEAY